MGRVWTTQRGPRWREDRAGATVGREGGKVARPGSQPPSACRRVVWATVGSVAHRPLAACRVAPPGSIVPPPTQSPRWSGPAGQISRPEGRAAGAWAGGGWRRCDSRGVLALEALLSDGAFVCLFVLGGRALAAHISIFGGGGLRVHVSVRRHACVPVCALAFACRVPVCACARGGGVACACECVRGGLCLPVCARASLALVPMRGSGARARTRAPHLHTCTCAPPMAARARSHAYARDQGLAHAAELDRWGVVPRVDQC